MTKVLVFESDPAFAGELRTELGRFQCSVQVVDDGNVGLQAASAERPDLILLSIELPRMNGFSVCNKLKKDPQLKDVPLIIMSSESSDETFEQHRKLRTRAEDYVHKPIAFVDLLEHIRAYVAIDAGPPPEGEVDDLIAFDEAEVLDEPAPPPVVDAPPVHAPVHARQAMGQNRHTPAPFEAVAPEAARPREGDPDSEIDAFIGGAFDRLLSDDDESTFTKPASDLLGLAQQPTPPAAQVALASPPTAVSAPAPSAPAVQLTPAPVSVPAPVAPTPARLSTSPLPLRPAIVAPVPPAPVVASPALSRATPVSSRAVPVATSSTGKHAAVFKVSDALPADVTADLERMRGELERSRAELDFTKAEVVKLTREASEAGAHAHKVELDAGEQAQEAQRLRRELDDLKVKASAAPGAAKASNVSSREFLDLREALNKKDKEILSLRDQMARKDKDGLELRDQNLSLEHQKADQNDRLLELERAAEDRDAEAETARTERDAAVKRTDELKAAADKAAAELSAARNEAAAHKSRATDVDAELAKARAGSAETEQKVAAIEAAHKAALRSLADDHEKEIATAEAAARKARDEAVGAERARLEAVAVEAQKRSADEAAQAAAARLAAREGELAAERDRGLKELEGKHAQALAAKDAELAKARADADVASGAKAEVEARASAAKAEVATAKNLVAATEARMHELETSLGKRALELEHVNGRAQAAEQKLAAAEADLAARTQERDAQATEAKQRADEVANLEARRAELEADLGRERGRLEKARAKWGEDRASLEKARASLGAAIEQIQAAVGRPIE